MIYFTVAYILMCVGLGTASNFIKEKWSLLLSLVMILAGILLSTWPDIDVATWGVWKTISRTLFYGLFWSTLPCTGIFAITFVVGRYGYQLISRWRRASRRE